MNFYSLEDETGKYHWNFIYFHNRSEDVVDAERQRLGLEWTPPDLVSSDTSRDSVEDGIYDVMVYGHPAKLFLWTNGTVQAICSEEESDSEWIEQGISFGHTRSVPNRRGLIVLDNYLPDLQYAQIAFETKKNHL